MYKKPVIRRFNRFSLQSGTNSDLDMRIQDVVDYAESRFWCILNVISTADENRQSWCQILLQRELVL